MKKKLAITLFAILFAFPFCAQAMTFTSDGTIQAGDDYWMGVSIYDTPPNHTHVTMTGGNVGDSMNVHNASTLNMSGGTVAGLNALDQSLVNISGGSIAGLQVFNSATVTLSQSAIVGSASAYSGIINMKGGSVSFLDIEESSLLNLHGGDITDLLVARISTTVNVFGYDLAKTNTGGIYGEGQITGFWQNGSSFTINIGGPDTYSRINLIPEPATLLLLGAGAFLLRKSHKQ